MPRGDKSKYTGKQERKADHIAESYEARGVPEKEAERRAWATVNRESGGGKKSGSGRGQLNPTPHHEKAARLAPSISEPFSGRAFGFGQESCGHSQAARLALNAKTSCSRSFAKPF